MSPQPQIITLDVLPSTSISPNTPTGTLLHRTLLALQNSQSQVLWASSSTNPLKLLSLLQTTSPTTTSTLLSPLAPLLAHPPMIKTFPTPASGQMTPILPPPDRPTDILVFTFDPATTLTDTSKHTFHRAVNLLTTYMPTASLPNGRDDNPCTLHHCAFEPQERKAHVWLSWKSKEERGRLKSGMGRTANLRIMMGKEFEGCDWEEMGEGFWEPLRWLGAEVEEEGCRVFREVEERESEGWFGWMGRWVG